MKGNDNRKLFQTIKNNLDDFLSERINIVDLINVLELLILSMEERSNLRSIFLKEWSNLEIAYAVSLDRGETEMSLRGQEIVNVSVERLKNLVDEQLYQYKKIPDLSISSEAKILDESWLMCPVCVDGWESISTDAMVICPKCDHAFHNPRYQPTEK